MSKIMIFNGSPRPKGYTMQMLREVIKGAESEGAVCSLYDLNNPNIRPCQGCFRCRRHAGCSQSDYLSPMYEELKDCDGIVVGAPIYFCEPSAQAKVLMDRLTPMFKGEFDPRYPGKKFATIYPVGDVDLTNYQPHMDFYDSLFTYFGWEQVDQIVVNGTWEIENYFLSEELKERAFRTGAELAKHHAPVFE